MYRSLSVAVLLPVLSPEESPPASLPDSWPGPGRWSLEPAQVGPPSRSVSHCWLAAVH